MKSFSLKTKESICKTIANKPCCIDAEIAGFLLFSGRLENNIIRVTSESAEVLKHIAVLIKRSTGTQTTVDEGKNCFYCILPHKKLMDMLLMYEISSSSLSQLYTKDECCHAAFLKGAFLGGGILVDPNKNYNMEFITPSESVCDDFKVLLNQIGFDFKKAERRSSFVLYTRQSEVICDYLSMVGAFAAQMEILNVKIEREMRNDWNRVANSENANFDKVITASVKQLRAIEKLEKHIGLDELPQELRDIALLRKQNKDLSLDALGALMSPKLSKSGVNHRMKKILDMAENIQ